MNLEYNVYCDESCHLQNDKSNVMVLGAVWCPKNKKDEIFTRLKEIKEDYGFVRGFEVKWNKVSEARIDFYLHLIDYFFDDDDLHSRVLVIPNKKELDHKLYEQTYDEFYYKMYFDLLKVILTPDDAYNIYLDIKDTQGQRKVNKLKDVLRNNKYDYQKKIIKEVQQVHSNEVQLLQITDLLIGAISYLHRGLSTSQAKLKIIDRIKKRSGYSLMQTTLLREKKTNVFIWKSSNMRDQ